MRFRERFGFIGPQPLTWDNAPQSLRNRIIQVFRRWHEWITDSGGTNRVFGLYRTTCFELGLSEQRHAVEYLSNCVLEIEGLIAKLQWQDFFEFVEIFAGYANHKGILDEINDALARDNIGWRLNAGFELSRLEQEPSATKSVVQALSALQHPRLKEVRIHYEKALSLYNSLRQPDPENAIKEAVLCLEEVGKIVTGNPNATLGEVAGSLAGSDVPRPLDKVLHGLHGYTSKNWIRHSGGKVSPEEAQFVIALASNCIAYLAGKLRSQGEPKG
jgi:hypothetical protein